MSELDRFTPFVWKCQQSEGKSEMSENVANGVLALDRYYAANVRFARCFRNAHHATIHGEMIGLARKCQQMPVVPGLARIPIIRPNIPNYPECGCWWEMGRLYDNVDNCRRCRIRAGKYGWRV